MKFQLFTKVVLTTDIPEDNLKKGDIATIVDHHPIKNGEDGYSLEVFNAIGETIAVITVPESQIEALQQNYILSVRPLSRAA
jgi:hypothetical protein